MRVRQAGAGLLIAGFAVLLATHGLQAQATNGVQVRVGGYLQVETELSSLGTEANGRLNTQLNRVRPRLDFTLDEWITGRIEIDFGQGRTRMRYAHIDFAVTEDATIRVGQYKKPFGLLQTTSSSTIPVIQRGVRISGLEDRVDARGTPVRLPDGDPVLGEEQTLLDEFGYQSYAVGLGVEGTSGRITYEAGVFDSPAGDPGNGGKGGAAARLTLEAMPGISIGTGVSYSRLRFDGAVEDGTAGSLEFAFGATGVPEIGLLAEGVLGQGVGTDTNFAGLQAIAWLHRALDGRIAGVEPVLRVSWGDPDTDGDEDAGVLFTAGLNLYLGGRNRLMLDWDVYKAQNADVGTESALRAQAQVRF